MFGISRLQMAGALGFVMACASGFAQERTSDRIQLAANLPPSQIAPAASAVSLESLQNRIDSQQQEISELRALVIALESKLQSSPQVVASASPIAFPDPAPGPAPFPSPAPQAAAPGASSLASTITYRNPRELLPDIGQIGAEVGLLVGGSTNPFKDNSGFSASGFIDLPWKKMPGGKLSYEIMVGLQRSVTTQTTTSGVNVLANGIVNSYLGNTAATTSLASYLTGPLPITSTVQENAKVLTVAPLLLKYSFDHLGRLRPYFVFGLGTYVWIGNDSNTTSFNANTALGSLANAPVGSSTLGATLNALLQGSQIGGLVPTAPQLAARGVPAGQGNILFGGQFGGGLELRISPRLSLGVDVRRNQLEGSNSSFTSFTFRQGLHW